MFMRLFLALDAKYVSDYVTNFKLTHRINRGKYIQSNSKFYLFIYFLTTN